MWSKYSLRCPFSGSIITLNHLCGRSASLSPAPPEDRVAVWWHLLHRGIIWVPFRPHRGAGRPLQLLAAHQSLLWLGQSWTRPLQRTIHVDPLLQWWRAGGDWLQGPVQLYCRWLKHSGMFFIDPCMAVFSLPHAWYSLNVHPVCSNNAWSNVSIISQSNICPSSTDDASDISLSVSMISPKDPEFHLHVGGLLNPIPGSATTQLILRFIYDAKPG